VDAWHYTMIIPVSIDLATSTFTANDRFPFANGQQVSVDSRIPKQVPVPLEDFDAQGQRVLYYLVNVSGNNFQLSKTFNGAPVALTANGIGQITVSEFPPLTWDALIRLPLIEISELRDRFNTPESLINLSAANDQPKGVSVASSVFTSGIPHQLLDWGEVRFTSTGTIPAPLQAGVSYYARDIASDSTFKVASVIGGSPIMITNSGTGQVSVQNYALNSVLEKKRDIAGRWLYDALLLKVSNHMKFISRSWWWWFAPSIDPIDPMLYPVMNRALIVLDNLLNPEKLIDAWIDYTAWAMVQDAQWRNVAVDAQFFQRYGDTSESTAKKRAEQRLNSLAPLLLVSGYQGARKIFDFDQTTASISVSLI